MKRIFIFFAFIFLSVAACACGTDAQREKMVAKLYADADMQRFVCARDSCSMEEFRGGLLFREYERPFRGRLVSVCLIEPSLTSTNSYAGVFAKMDGDFAFQFISYGTGVKVDESKSGVTMILEYGVSDSDNSDYSVNQYSWNGEAFIFSRSLPLHN